LYKRNVDYKIDLRNIPFENHSYGFVFTSHVLEHIKEDTLAVFEINRILKLGGIAIIPVPVVAYETIEYPSPNPHDSEHVRVRGFDYYDRFSSFFEKIEKYDSKSFPEEFQLFVYEDRTI
jgi:predicted SAM-dependent methyltransferase